MNAENSVNQRVVIPTNPGLLADLSRNEGLRNWDSVLADVLFLFDLSANVILGRVDKWFGWTSGSGGRPRFLCGS